MCLLKSEHNRKEIKIINFDPLFVRNGLNLRFYLHSSIPSLMLYLLYLQINSILAFLIQPLQQHTVLKYKINTYFNEFIRFKDVKFLLILHMNTLYTPFLKEEEMYSFYRILIYR